MDISDAVASRKSVRAFLVDPVTNDTLRSLLDKAARAPSGGNVQPWRIYVVNGESMVRLRAHLVESEPFEEPGYDIYPAKLWEPYRSNRYGLGEQMYATLGIGRDDKAGRLEQFARNGDFFGAPAAIFCYIDRGMGPPQWSDLGMFLQTFMLLAQETGLDTCPQEYWTVRQNAVGAFVDAPAELMLFCGVAIGKADRQAPINSLVSERLPLDQWCSFV
ncbi:MAG: nitroreductase [Acidimicrobiales bacterium]